MWALWKTHSIIGIVVGILTITCTHISWTCIERLTSCWSLGIQSEKGFLASMRFMSEKDWKLTNSRTVSAEEGGEGSTEDGTFHSVIQSFSHSQNTCWPPSMGQALLKALRMHQWRRWTKPLPSGHLPYGVGDRHKTTNVRVSMRSMMKNQDKAKRERGKKTRTSILTMMIR